MATLLENLITRRDAIGAELAAGETPDGQSFRHPSISVDGESVPTVQYVESLTRQLKLLREEIGNAGGGWEVVSRGI